MGGIIQGRNQKALVNRQRVRVEEGDLQIVSSQGRTARGKRNGLIFFKIPSQFSFCPHRFTNLLCSKIEYLCTKHFECGLLRQHEFVRH